MRIQARILMSSAGAIGFVPIASGIATHHQMQNAAIEQAVQRSIAVVGAAEAAREHVALLHEQGALDLPSLLEDARKAIGSGSDYRSTAAFHAVPIVVAIETAKGAAKSAGLDFTVTAPQARNRVYDPKCDTKGGAFRSALLADVTAQARNGGAAHLWRVDEENDTLVFQHAGHGDGRRRDRPVRQEPQRSRHRTPTPGRPVQGLTATPRHEPEPDGTR